MPLSLSIIEVTAVIIGTFVLPIVGFLLLSWQRRNKEDGERRREIYDRLSDLDTKVTALTVSYQAHERSDDTFHRSLKEDLTEFRQEVRQEIRELKDMIEKR